jgi:hypothetical protein
MTVDEELEMVKAVMVLEEIQVLAVVETMRGREEWRLKREWGDRGMSECDGGGVCVGGVE